MRERAQWRAPRKVVLLEFAAAGWAPREAFAAAAPGAQLVVAPDLAAAAGAMADADVVIGFNPEICQAQLLDKAKQLRWIASLAAGVERCMAVPSVHSRHRLVTNMRGVDSAVIAEHAIALTLALAHGLDTFAVDTSKGSWNSEHGETTRIQTLNGKTMLVVGLGGIGTEVAMRAHGLGMKVIATRDSDRSKPDFVAYVGLPDELLTLAIPGEARWTLAVENLRRYARGEKMLSVVDLTKGY